MGLYKYCWKICQTHIKYQYSALRALKEIIREDDIVLQIELAENYLCKYGNEIQAVHFADSHQRLLSMYVWPTPKLG